MALTITQLDSATSYLLAYEPISTENGGPTFREPFRILLDPVLTKQSHSKSTTAIHKPRSWLSSLPDPDVVIVSNHKSNHCNEFTLRQLSRSSTKTKILAEPEAAREIRSWQHFDIDKVHVLQRWEDNRVTGTESVVRIPIAPNLPGGEAGEVTISFITERRGRHSAIGITYRPPPSQRPARLRRFSHTPPTTPRITSSYFPPQLAFPRPPRTSPVHFLPPPSPALGPPSSPPPFSPPPLPPTRRRRPVSPNPPLPTMFSAFPRPISPSPFLPTPPGSPLPSIRSFRSSATPKPHSVNRAVSLIFSPNGIPYSAIENYATTHLLSEAALPLTALLHGFDEVNAPWWVGGKISMGMPSGVAIASKLGAKLWLGTHDVAQEVTGFRNRLSKKRRHGLQDVRREVWLKSRDGRRPSKNLTEILSLVTGEDIILTSEGIWDVEPEMASPLMQTSFGAGDLLMQKTSDMYLQLPQLRSPRF